MTPTHALFRELFALSKIRVSTFDYLPSQGTEYPFIYIGENNGQEVQNNDLLGTLRQTVHIYGKLTDRPVLDDISAYLESEVQRISGIYDFNLSHIGTSKQVIPDNTDVQPLLHIVLDFTFSFTKKGEINATTYTR